MRRVGVDHGARDPIGRRSVNDLCPLTIKRSLGSTLCLALILTAVSQAAGADMTPTDETASMKMLDFGAGFRKRSEPVFAQENVRSLFEASSAVTELLLARIAPSEPVFSRPEANALFATRSEPLAGNDSGSPSPTFDEPVFNRPEIIALVTDLAQTPIVQANDDHGSSVEAMPVFTRPEIRPLFVGLADARAGEEPPAVSREPVFTRPEIATLFTDRTDDLAGESVMIEPGAAPPAFAHATVAGLFVTRTEELAADLPDAPSPKIRFLVDREQAAVQATESDGPTITGSLSPDVGDASKVARGSATDDVKMSSLKPARRIGGGRAVWYEHPGRTANGETFDPEAMTAGHRTLPFGTRVRVVNLKTRRSVVVRINDRGPVQKKFEIDLSRGSARSGWLACRQWRCLPPTDRKAGHGAKRVVPPPGLEPGTPRSTIWCSNQLSYGGPGRDHRKGRALRQSGCNPAK